MNTIKFDDPKTAEEFEEALLADGFEQALLGFGTQFHHAIAIYDYDACVQILMGRDNMSYDDALEHMEFNVVGSWMGKHTPVFMHAFVQDIESIQ